MFMRVMNLLLFEPNRTEELVERSYDRISSGYDEAWTGHTRDLSQQLVERLKPARGAKALDLMCGTGFVTNLLAQETAQKVIGVDKSQGMLIKARENHGRCCEFVNSDVLTFLKGLPAESFDIVSCCWGLGYSRPFKVLREVKRILREGGRVGVIDNSIFSLAGVFYCSILTFTEQPEKLSNVMLFRFLLRSQHVGFLWRALGMKPLCLWDGSRSYDVRDGVSAIERLRMTGAAAGFEYAAEPEDEKEIFQRFAEIIESRFMKDNTIKITHRYLAGIAEK